jgi:hypothetical protein
MKLDARVSLVLEQLGDQRAFIVHTLRILNEQMAVVERCIQTMAMAANRGQEAAGACEEETTI